MNIVHLLVPGLMRSHVEGALALGALARDPPQRRSELVLSFPATPANVQATMLSGCTARRRGGLTHALLPLGPAQLAGQPGGVQVVESTGSWPPHGAVHLHFSALCSALQQHGASSPAEHAALGRLDALLVEILGHCSRVLVTSGPVLQPVERVVVLPASVRGDVQVSGALAFFASALDPGARDELLGTAGVERVLQGEALESWGASAAIGAVALAEPRASFTAHCAVHGHREILERAHAPVVLAWGKDAPGDWPAAVHDYRIAPTLASACGIAASGCEDRGLDW